MARQRVLGVFGSTGLISGERRGPSGGTAALRRSLDGVRRLSGNEPYRGQHEQGLVQAGGGEVEAQPAAVAQDDGADLQNQAIGWLRRNVLPSRLDGGVISTNLVVLWGISDYLFHRANQTNQGEI